MLQLLQLLLLQLLLLRLQFSLLLLLSHQLPLLPLPPNQRYTILDGLCHGLVVALGNIARLNLQIQEQPIRKEKSGT